MRVSGNSYLTWEDGTLYLTETFYYNKYCTETSALYPEYGHFNSRGNITFNCELRWVEISFSLYTKRVTSEGILEVGTFKTSVNSVCLFVLLFSTHFSFSSNSFNWLIQRTVRIGSPFRRRMFATSRTARLTKKIF